MSEMNRFPHVHDMIFGRWRSTSIANLLAFLRHDECPMVSQKNDSGHIEIDIASIQSLEASLKLKADRKAEVSARPTNRQRREVIAQLEEMARDLREKADKEEKEQFIALMSQEIH